MRLCCWVRTVLCVSGADRLRFTKNGQTRLRRVGTKSNEKWHVPEIETARSQPQNLRSNSPIAQWKDTSSILLQVLAWPTGSSSESKRRLAESATGAGGVVMFQAKSSCRKSSHGSQTSLEGPVGEVTKKCTGPSRVCWRLGMRWEARLSHCGPCCGPPTAFPLLASVYRGVLASTPPMCLDAQGGIKAKRQPFCGCWSVVLVNVLVVVFQTRST